MNPKIAEVDLEEVHRFCPEVVSLVVEAVLKITFQSLENNIQADSCQFPNNINPNSAFPQTLTLISLFRIELYAKAFHLITF